MTRIALAATGDPLAVATWSGTPVGVARGLRAHGASVSGVDATPPRGVREAAVAAAALRRRSRVDAWYTPELFRLRSAVVARRLAPVDGVVLMGAEFGLPAGTRYVTLSDLTLVQARATHPVFSRLSDGVFEDFDRRQRQVYAAAVGCCTASHWTAASLREDYGVPAEKVHVVGLGPNHEAAGRGRRWGGRRAAVPVRRPRMGAQARPAAACVPSRGFATKCRRRGSTWLGNTRRWPRPASRGTGRCGSTSPTRRRG